jgi:hypothetical protein
MNKKILVGLSILGVSVGFWACGDGSVEAKSGDDELALLNYGEFNEGGMAGLVSGAMSECEADPACAAKMEGSTYVPPEQEPESTDSGETTTPGGDSGTPGNTTPGNATPGNTTPGNTTPGNTTPASSPADVSSSSTAPSTNPTVSSSSVQQQTTVSSSSAQQQTTPSSSSVQQQTQPSSNSQQSSASSVDPTGATPIELVYGQTTKELTGGKWSVTSNNQYSGILFCKADESVTVTADGNKITVTSSETNYGNIKPRSGSPVIIEVPDGKTIECRTDW